MNQSPAIAAVRRSRNQDADALATDAENRNQLTEEHQDRIVRTSQAFEMVDKYACPATPQEIKPFEVGSDLSNVIASK